MTQYFIRRLLLIVPTFIGITILVFVVTRFVPGGPIERMIAESQQATMESSGISQSGSGMGAVALDQDQIRQLEEYYGFDQPVLVSYWQWMLKVVQFDLGVSTRYSEPVWDTIKERLPISAFYGITTMLITYFVSIPLGYLKAVRHSSHFDHVSSIIVFIGYAIPAYVVGIILLVVFAANLELFPMGGFYGDEFEDMESVWEQALDIFYHAVLPLLAYVSGSFAVMTFMMKNALMDNLAADYVRTAIAKGFSFRQSITRHALRNSLIPIATHFGNNISVIIGGSFLIEKIFNIDGLGLLGYESIVERDYPVVMGVLVISAILQLLGNILSDVCVAIVDPRVQFR